MVRVVTIAEVEMIVRVERTGSAPTGVPAVMERPVVGTGPGTTAVLAVTTDLVATTDLAATTDCVAMIGPVVMIVHVTKVLVISAVVAGPVRTPEPIVLWSRASRMTSPVGSSTRMFAQNCGG